MTSGRDTAVTSAPLCVLVHGFVSGPTAWDPLLHLVADDPNRADLPEFETFDYWTKIASLRPDRMIPTLDVVADQLRTVLELVPIDRPVVLVGHSQGGLVIQRYLARQLRDHQLDALARIPRVVLFACPNYGSDKLLLLRRMVSRKNAQERELRPFNESVSETHRVVLRDFVHPPAEGPRTSSIAWSVFYATMDTTVSAASSRGGFPQTFALNGDHSTIITPGSRDTANYRAFRAAVNGSLPTTSNGVADNSSPTTGPLSKHEQRFIDGTGDPPDERGTDSAVSSPIVPPRPEEDDGPPRAADDAKVSSAVEGTDASDSDESVHTASHTAPGGDALASAGADSVAPAALSLREQVEARRAGADEWLANVIACLSTAPDSANCRDALLELRRQGVVSGHGFRVRLADRGVDVFVRVTPEDDGVLLRLEHFDGTRVVPFDMLWPVDETALDFLTRLDEVVDSAGTRPATFDVTSWLEQLSTTLPMVRARRARVAGYEDLSKAIQFCPPQWVIYDWGLYAVDHPYSVGSERLDELDWFRHMSGKVWVDNDSFYEALTTAQALRRNGLLD